jgi:hypothetical protein
MFKRTATDFDVQLTTMQQRLTRAFKNATLLPDGWCCSNSMGNEILFRINILQSLATIAGLYWAALWLDLPGHRTSHKWTSSYGASHKLILKRISLPVSLRQQQPLGSNITFLTLNLPMTTVVAQPFNVIKWQLKFNPVA